MVFIDDLQLIYGDVIEPIFCLLYAYLLVRIIISKSATLHSPFYLFSVATGVAAISNVLLNYVTRIIDIRTRWFSMETRGLPCVLISWLSHLFALSMTIGKILSVFTRFTAISMPIRDKIIWTPSLTKRLLIVMFSIPFVLYVFFPFQPPLFVPTTDGDGRFAGINGDGYMVAKAIGTAGYLLFFVTTIPMCSISIVRLRKERMRAVVNRAQETRMHEITLLISAVILTVTHMFKSVIQTIWFIALYIDDTNLQSLMVKYYMIPNTLSSFAEPILLIFTSSKVRMELTCRERRYDSKLVSTVSNHPAQRHANI